MQIIYSPEWEAKRLIYTLRLVNYSANKAPIVHNLAIYREFSIVYPKFTPSFQKNINKLIGDRNEAYSSELVKLLENYLIKHGYLISENDFKNLKVKANNFYSISRKLCKEYIDKQKEPNKIQITSFGTPSSFTYGEWTMYSGVGKIICLRRDFSLIRVMTTLLRSLLGKELSDLGFNSNQQLEIIRFLTGKLTNSELPKSKYFFDSPGFTEESLKKHKTITYDGKLKFLNGFFKTYNPQKYNILSTPSLTAKEVKFIKLLESTKGVCTYDRIAEILWGQKWHEEFSLEAIYKQVSRIKNKLDGMGQDSSKIVSVTNVGYSYNK